MHSGGSAPANVGGEPPNGRAKGQRVCTSPPPEETQRPSVLAHVNDLAYSRFETGTHSRSPLQGAITRGAPHVPPKITEKAARHPTTKTREKGTLRTQSPDVCRLTAGQTEKMSAHDAEPRCLGLKPRLCGWKKKEPRRVVQVVGPQKPSAAERDRYGIACLDGPSEIRAGSLGT